MINYILGRVDYMQRCLRRIEKQQYLVIGLSIGIGIKTVLEVMGLIS